MDIRPIVPGYAVSPQISPSDAQAIADAGYVKVICNRPDEEVPPALQAQNMRAAIEAAGLQFEFAPVTHDSMTPERIAAHGESIAAASGPVLAYCASGTRCTILWALSQAGKMGTTDILSAAGNAGYALEPLRAKLDSLRG